jgi:energy-coupling factor transporter ATP-binding protein EcfA2
MTALVVEISGPLASGKSKLANDIQRLVQAEYGMTCSVTEVQGRSKPPISPVQTRYAVNVIVYNGPQQHRKD